jgi:hypothetical protein
MPTYQAAVSLDVVLVVLPLLMIYRTSIDCLMAENKNARAFLDI